MDKSVDHNICAVLLLDACRLLLGLLVTVGTTGLSLVHLHVIVPTFLAFALTLFLVILALRVLNIDLFATSLRLGVFVIGRACSILSTSHSSILAFNRGALGFLLLLFLFFDAVLVAVCVEVGLGLLRRELGRCRFVRIPVLISLAQWRDASQ